MFNCLELGFLRYLHLLHYSIYLEKINLSVHTYTYMRKVIVRASLWLRTSGCLVLSLMLSEEEGKLVVCFGLSLKASDCENQWCHYQPHPKSQS